MTFLGDMLVQHRRTGVAFERLDRLLVNAPADEIIATADLQLHGERPPFSGTQPLRKQLDTLSVHNLSYQFPDGTAGIKDVSFTLKRGTLTVITGRIGAGKTTLLRVLLGLLPADSGEIRWNGELITDPAAFFVPPHTAYTSQVPRLFSDSLRENLLLGETDQHGAIDRALDLAVFSQDVTTLEKGLDTQVGSRGVKLSGGQVQRSAAARMFLRDAELLVFDDLSSALDVETEARLWDRVFAQGDATCLVVSHRPAALERADQVLELEGGRLVG
jgi:ABC-type multidrug transport system fused ATPase/permease subunit